MLAISVPANNVQIWSCLDANCTKINCDGSFCKLEEEARIGVVVRNENGGLIDGFCATFRAPNATMTEACDIRNACMVAATFKLVGLIVETNRTKLFDVAKGFVKLQIGG